MAESDRRFFTLRPLEFDLGDMLVQVVAVALGVILGFSVTTWSERNHQRELLRQTVGNIVDELRSNQIGLRQVMVEHTKADRVMQALEARSLRSEYASFTDSRAAIQRAGAYRENVPLAIAWQIAQSDQGLTLLPYKDRYDLAWVYQVQTIYYEAESRYGTSLLTLTAAPNGNYLFEVVNLANQLHVLVSAERQLDTLYTATLARVKREFP
jgi:hypothetical protein